MESLDPGKLVFVGAGKEGRVYLLDGKGCIKYYNHGKYQHREWAALNRGQNDELFPRLYGWGDGYIIREYIKGVSLDKYLAVNPMTEELAKKLLRMHETLIRLGYRRADLRLTHIIINPDGQLRVIDPTNMMKIDRVFPRKLLHGLEKLGQLAGFLAFVRRLRPEIYREWERKLG
jgi:RIO-like serine/threonine protein kinase